MPGEFSQTGGNRALDALTGRAAVTGHNTGKFLALCSTAPTDTALGTEILTAGSGGYARQAVTWSAPTGDPSSTSNSATITFGPFSSDPANATHAMLMDAATGGTAANMVMHWQLDTARDAAIGDSISIASGSLVMTVD
jgi:hypothetical protein